MLGPLGESGLSADLRSPDSTIVKMLTVMSL